MRAAELALEIAQRETELDPRNGFAWFNLGTSLVALERYDEATQSDMTKLHGHMTWHSNTSYLGECYGISLAPTRRILQSEDWMTLPRWLWQISIMVVHT